MSATHTAHDEKIRMDFTTGFIEYVSPEAQGVCSVCLGQGKVVAIDAWASGFPNEEETCGYCGGDGKSVRREENPVCQES